MRDGEVWVDNPAPPLIKKLDELPMPARHLLPMERYFQLNPERLAYIFTTRGCPFKCIFCQKELTGRGFRVRSTEMIVDELEHIVKTYNPGVILFVDEILTLRRKRIHEMCDEILRRGLKFEWIANTRADCVDYPLLKHMHRAGCRRIYYGWESGSQRMLDVLKKDLTPEVIVEAAQDDAPRRHLGQGLPDRRLARARRPRTSRRPRRCCSSPGPTWCASACSTR